MNKELKDEIEAAINRLILELHKFDAEINYLENLGYTSSTQYDSLRCRFDGVEVFGKDNEEFGLWDKFAEEAPYEEAVEEAKATGECILVPMPFLSDLDSGDVVSLFEGVDKMRLNDLIELVNTTADFGARHHPLDIPSLLVKSRVLALEQALTAKDNVRATVQKL